MSNPRYFDQDFQMAIVENDQKEVVKMIVWSAGRLVITNEPMDPSSGTLVLPAFGSLTVYADRLRIRGRIKSPGANVVIYTRILETEKDTAGEGAAVVVDGVAGAPPSALAIPAAQDGANGETDGEDGSPGGPGVPGLPGENGNNGEPAGSITIWAESLAKDSELFLSANGGAGGDGQPGQDGGHGGYGGCGKDMSGSTRGGKAGSGGNGGRGGDGGRGGAAGVGGNGGEIEFKCLGPDNQSLAAPIVPGLTYSNHGGKGGLPGKGGKPGCGGGKGTGGMGGNYTTGPVIVHCDPGDDGSDGASGNPGPPGDGTNGGRSIDGEGGALPSKSAAILAAFSNVVEEFHAADQVAVGAELRARMAAQKGGSQSPEAKYCAQIAVDAYNQAQGARKVRDAWTSTYPVREVRNAGFESEGINEQFIQDSTEGVQFEELVAQFLASAYPALEANTAGSTFYGIMARSMSSEYLQVLLERARACYLAAGNPNATPVNSAAVQETKELLFWLKHLADNDLKPLTEPRRGTYAQANNLGMYLKYGKDWMGQSPDWVPLGTIDYWDDQLTPALSALKDLENNYHEYYAENADDKAKLDSLQLALQSSANLQTTLAGDIEDIEHQLKAQADYISDKTVRALAANANLLGGLVKLTGAIDNASGITWEQVSAVLQNLAFLSTEAFQRTCMLTSQLGNLGDAAIDKIKDDNGNQIEKSYAVKTVHSFAQGLQGLQDGISVLPNGTLSPDDANAVKLLGAKEDALLDFLDRIETWAAGKIVRQDLEDYVALENEKNQAIIDYNSLVWQWLAAINELDATKARHTDVSQTVTQTSEPGLAACVSFLGAAYEQAKRRCLKYLYMKSRAGVFYALNPDIKLIQSSLDSSGLLQVGQINYSVISKLKADVDDAISRAHESLATTQEQKYGENNPLVLTLEKANSTYSGIFALLKSGSSFSLTLDPSKDQALTNIFSGKCDVRVTKVQVWLDGKFSNQSCRITIVHGGSESLVKDQDTTVAVRHLRVARQFQYNLQQPTQDGIIVDGEFTTEDRAAYAPIGPFACWTFVFGSSDEDNNVLDLSGLTQIRIAFSGTFRSMTQLAG